MKFAYFPGCSMKGPGQAYEESLLAVMRHLGVELREVEGWSCCGATAYLSVDEAQASVLAARSLALAEASGLDQVVAPCSACHLALNKAKSHFHDYPAIKGAVDRALSATGMRYSGDTPVRHPLDILLKDVGIDSIKAKVERPLNGLKVAPYYGCQIVRPYAALDDQPNPTALDELLEALGATVVPYPLKTRCCGGSLSGILPHAGARMIYIFHHEARKRGADCLATVCPLCQINFDVKQAEVAARYGPVTLPTAHFTQLMALAFGISETASGLRSTGTPTEFGLPRAAATLPCVSR